MPLVIKRQRDRAPRYVKVTATTTTDDLVLAWLETNGPWLMKLKPEKIMWRVGLELNHGKIIGRSTEESLIAAGAILRQEYENGGESYETQTASKKKESEDDG